MNEEHDGSIGGGGKPDDGKQVQRLVARVSLAVAAAPDQQATGVIFAGLEQFFPDGTTRTLAVEARVREHLDAAIGELTKEDRGAPEIWKRLAVEALRLVGLDERGARDLVDRVAMPSTLCWTLRESNEIRELSRHAARARLDGRDDEASEIERQVDRRIDEQIHRARG